MPATALALAETCSKEVPAELGIEAVSSEDVTPIPDGVTADVRPTVPVNPLMLLMVMVDVAEEPGATVNEDVSADIAKSGT